MMTDLLESLNPVQRKAIQHTEGPLLILSGGGQRQNPRDYASNRLPHPAPRRFPV